MLQLPNMEHKIPYIHLGIPEVTLPWLQPWQSSTRGLGPSQRSKLSAADILPVG